MSGSFACRARIIFPAIAAAAVQHPEILGYLSSVRQVFIIVIIIVIMIVIVIVTIIVIVKII